MFQFLTTPQGIVVFAALIGAGTGFLGQLVVGAISIAKDVYLDRRKSRRSARFLSLQLVLILDAFSADCYAAAMNNEPEINPSDPFEFRFRTDTPELTFPEGAPWETLVPKLMDEVLWLENRARNVRAAHASLDPTPPDYDDLFEHRAEDYSNLGVAALRLIDTICRRYGVKAPVRPAYYEPLEGFTRQLDRSKQFWKAREESNKKLWENVEAES